MTKLRPHAALTVALLFSGFGGAGTLLAQDGRQLDGVAHVALRVSDVAKSRAFYKTLGWEQAFEFSDDQGTTTSYVKVNDLQFIELYRRSKPSDPLGLMHICLLTGDVDRVSAAYTALGLVPTQPRKARAGNLLFNLRDPEGQVIEYTQYLPGSLHYEDHGKHVSEARISDHMINVVMTAKDVDAEKSFFTGKLGFSASGYKLGVPGTPGETIELKPSVPGAIPELRFAADPKRAAAELKKRGLDVKLSGGVPAVRDPDGVAISFSDR
jgi:catechol 2,3-dioxygenase-like lactoylglutathione lyase family enzyme